MTSSGKKFLVMDPVHGSIELTGDYICPIIDSKEFQRLRKLKQLGGASYVYPGATHTRFEHSIGVCYIASELIEHLKTHCDESIRKIFDKWNGKIFPDIVKCVKTAALCHDLGHGPFSHLYDVAIKSINPSSDPLSKHEYRSVQIFEIIAKNIKKPSATLFTENEIALIGELITFSENFKECKGDTVDEKLQDWLGTKFKNESEECYKNRKEIMFLFEIVANGITGVDVDKMDYFLRDSHSTGLKNMFDWRRFIQTSEIKKKKEDGMNRLCSREKEALQLYELFHIRDQLYRQAYHHKTNIAVQYMLQEAFKEARENLFIIGNGKCHSVLDAWKDESMECFLLLNDSLEDIISLPLSLEKLRNEDDIKEAKKKESLQFYWVTQSDKPQSTDGQQRGLSKAKEIIDNIRKRNIVKFIGDMEKADNTFNEAKEDFKRKLTKLIAESKATDMNGLKEEIKKLCDETDTPAITKQEMMMQRLKNKLENLKQEDKKAKIICESASFHYGMKDKDPLKDYLFFKKIDNGNPDFLRRDEISKMLPDTFIEEKWMFYVDMTDSDNNHSVLSKLKEEFARPN